MRWQFRPCPRHRWFFRREWLRENLFEIINVPEIFDRIVLGFSEYPGANQVKNHVSDVLGRVNAPTIENRHDHRSELLERVLAQSLQELRSSHVPDAGAFRFLLLLGREIERVTQKN